MTKLLTFMQRHANSLLLAMTILLPLGFAGKFWHLPLVFDGTMLVVTLLGGLPLILRASEALKYKTIGIELLISLAILGALFIHEYEEAGMVVWLFSLGEFLEKRTLNQTRKAIKDLVALTPQTAMKITDQATGSYEEVDIDEVAPGDLLLAKNGAKIPVDGLVVSGDAFVNEANITGEYQPKHKTHNSKVFAGTLVASGTLTIQAEKVGEDSTFGKLLELVEEAQDSKTQTQKTIDKFAQYYTPLVLLLALILGLLTKNLSLAITVLVLGCPGALVIGVPVSTVAGVGSAARRGIVVKGGGVLEKATQIDTLVFDKTGTITTGQAKVTQVQNFSAGQSEALKILASVENQSDHPLAKAIKAFYQEDTFYPVTESTTINGLGIKAVVNGQQVLVGNERLLQQYHIATTGLALPEAASHVLLAVDGKLQLGVAISDSLRPNLAHDLKKLQDYKLIMLSGDKTANVVQMTQGLGFTDVRGNMLPEDKANYLKQLQQQGHHVAFIGDGVNDSVAMANSDLAIAMGSGSDTVIDLADMILVKSDIAQLATALTFARRTVNNMKQNIALALLTVLLLFIGLFTGFIYMASGMLVHELSILLVIFNGMRLLKIKAN
ncbi:heavy metal translocating P-type ATPase [Lactobacillus corticis]|uniref:Cd(2+)-exporting ATPase n=1 Tax=Lactobacillus corticis TaxID=2201249 RepID=A0A916QGA3_9LACO|nr:cation-translocating P-type ATPase [Lactobacillus corticis]GFZ26454.1 cation-transporting ATPase [Lactobacillus corticis]